MNHKPLLLLFLALFSLDICVAQPITEPLSRLVARGSLPGEFCTSATQLPYLNKRSLQTADRKLTQKQVRRFQQSIDYTTDRLVKSGMILYNDSVTHYLSGILDILLTSNPELKDKIKVYAIKSNLVNAFMLPNGMLFVNIGLIANSTSEADIAFIMAHEIVHFTNRHSLDLFAGGMSKDEDADNDVVDYLKYQYRSRSQETEADSKALRDIYLKTDYDRGAVTRVYDILQFAYLPFEELQFRRDDVEAPCFRFPDDYFAKRGNTIGNEKQELDTLSTHPNIPFRRINAQQVMDETTEGGNKSFIQSEQAFVNIRNLSRFECLNQYLLEGNYAEALFNVRILQRDFPNNMLLEEIRVASLYGIAKLKRSGQVSKLPSDKTAEGAFYVIGRFLKKLKTKEACLLALREAWICNEKYPDNKYLGLVCQDLLNDLIVGYKMKYSDFSDYGVNDSSYTQRVDSLSKITSKYDAGKAKSLIVPEADWETARYMLVDIKRDPDFLKAYNAVIVKD
jgi:hypothetical protein